MLQYPQIMAVENLRRIMQFQEAQSATAGCPAAMPMPLELLPLPKPSPTEDAGIVCMACIIPDITPHELRRDRSPQSIFVTYRQRVRECDLSPHPNSTGCPVFAAAQAAKNCPVYIDLGERNIADLQLDPLKGNLSY